jgi:hypothetical protein
MGFTGFFLKVQRWIRGKYYDLLDLIPIQKPDFSRNKRSRSRRKKRSSKKQYKDDVEYARNVHHIPLYKKFKQVLAVVLLLFNLIFSQFLLGTSSSGQIMFLVFLGNSFLIADYLWKSRRKPE